MDLAAVHDSQEQQYTAELAAELAGVPFSKASHRAEKIDESDDSDGDEEAQEESGSEEEEEEAEAKMPGTPPWPCQVALRNIILYIVKYLRLRSYTQEYCPPNEISLVYSNAI